MRVVLTTHYLLPHRGGIEVLAGELADALAAGGDRVTLVSSRIPREAAALEEGGPGGRVRRRRLPAWNGAEAMAGVPYPLLRPGAARRALREECAGDDAPVLHAQGLLYGVGAAASRFARRRGATFVVTEYVGEIPYPDPLRRFVQRLAFLGRGRAVARRADLLLLATPRLLGEAEGWTGGETAVAVLPSALDTAPFRPPQPGEREALRGAWGLPADRPVVLFVGRPTPRKGLPILEEALSILAGAAPLLVVAGTPPRDGDDPSVRRSFAALPRERLAELYRAVDLFVLPSTGEGFPVAAQEALLSGLPVLLSDDPGYVAAAEPGWIATVRPEARGVADALAALLGELPARRARLAADRPRMEARWSLAAAAAAHREAYATAGFFRRLPEQYAFARLDLSAHAKHPILRRFLSPLPARGLDVGLGTGWGGAALLGPRYVGVDAVLGNLLYARARARAAGGEPRLVLADGAKLPFADGAFDAVLSSEVLEHLDDDRTAAAELARVAAPGGRIAVTTPYSGLGFEGFLELLGVETVHRRPGPERHVRPGYDERSMDALFAPHGARPERREFFMKLFGKLAADAVAAIHLAYERVVLGRTEWTWSEAAETEGSLAIRVYRALFPLLSLGNRVDRWLPGRGFQVATLYRKGAGQGRDRR